MTGIYLHILAGLAQEIATSPTFMAGCPAQPRVGRQKWLYHANYYRYWLEILTGYGGHVGTFFFANAFQVLL